VEPLSYTKYVFGESEDVEDLILHSHRSMLLDLGGGKEGEEEGRLVTMGRKQSRAEGGRERGQQQQQQLYYMLTCGRGPALGFYSLGGGGTFHSSPLHSLPLFLLPSNLSSLPRSHSPRASATS